MSIYTNYWTGSTQLTGSMAAHIADHYLLTHFKLNKDNIWHSHNPKASIDKTKIPKELAEYDHGYFINNPAIMGAQYSGKISESGVLTELGSFDADPGIDALWWIKSTLTLYIVEFKGRGNSDEVDKALEKAVKDVSNVQDAEEKAKLEAENKIAREQMTNEKVESHTRSESNIMGELGEPKGGTQMSLSWINDRLKLIRDGHLLNGHKVHADFQPIIASILGNEGKYRMKRYIIAVNMMSLLESGSDGKGAKNSIIARHAKALKDILMTEADYLKNAIKRGPTGKKKVHAPDRKQKRSDDTKVKLIEIHRTHRSHELKLGIHIFDDSKDKTLFANIDKPKS